MRKKIATVVVAALALPGIARAQTPKAPFRDRVRTFLVLRIAEELDLSDEKALEMSKILREIDDQRNTLLDKRGTIETAVRTELAKPEPDTAKLTASVADANKVDEQLALIGDKAMQRLQSILDPKQQAKLVLLRPEIQKQVRSAIRRRLEEKSEEEPGSGGRHRRRLAP
jgi:hypothetical protein